jgi:hypothetical protein
LAFEEKGAVSFRKLFIYLGVLMVVAGIWVFVQFFASPQNEEEQNPPLFGAVSPDKIQEIHWQRGTETVKLKKNKEWEILQPISTRADAWVVDNLLRALTTLKAARRYSEKPPGGPEFGLDPPRVRISFLTQGKRSELLVGNKTVVGNDYYVKVSKSPDLLLVSDFSIQDLDRNLFDLREKKVFSLALDRIRIVEVHGPVKNFYLEKTPEGWKEKGGSGGILDSKRVGSFLDEWLQLRVKKFAGPGIDLPQWGLKNPSYQIRLLSTDKNAPEEVLSLGKEAAEKGLCAKSTLHSEVFFLNTDLLKKIPQTLEGWKAVAPSPPDRKGP